VENSYRIQLAPDMRPSPVDAVLVWAEGISSPSEVSDPPQLLKDRLAKAADLGDQLISEERRKRVRQMLRFGKYRASGRGKPASEFLMRAAIEEAFPLINPPVDVNNAISLASGYPGSLFDAVACGPELFVRRGVQEESYIFNASGQVIELADLLLVCRRVGEGWIPCGNPVKDSQATKIGPETRDVLAVLYVPAGEPRDETVQWAEAYADLLKSHCDADRVGWTIAWSDDAIGGAPADG